MAAKETPSVVMKQDKVCKSCVRFKADGDGAEQVASSLYVQNAAYEKLGKPKSIKVSIESA